MTTVDGVLESNKCSLTDIFIEFKLVRELFMWRPEAWPEFPFSFIFIQPLMDR